MKKALVIGSTVTDVILQLPHLPYTGEDINIQNQDMRIGGCAYNTAQILSLFQLPYTLCSPIGTGIYGDFVKQEIKKQGISTHDIYVDEPNGCCYCLVEANGERTFLSDHGAEYKFKREWFSSLSHQDYDIVYICGLEIEEPTGEEILSYLEEYPPSTLFFATGPRIQQIAQERMERIFALFPILHLNKEEAYAYTNRDEIESAARTLYHQTHNSVIITLGKDGCYLYEDQKGCTIPSIDTKVVDTIGAGDAHIGAVIAGLQQGRSLQDALYLANRIAAGVVSSKGATLQKEEFERIIQV